MNIRAPRNPLTTILAGVLAMLLAATGLGLTASPASAASGSATASSLDWGFKASWRGYLAMFGGTSTPSDGATASGAASFLWPAQSASYDPSTGAGSAQFGGSVRYVMSAHGIDVTLASPRVEWSGDGTGSLYYRAGDSEVLGATIGSLTVGSPVVTGATTTVTVTAASLAFTDANTAFDYSSATTPGPDGFSFTLGYATPAAPTSVTLTASHTAVVAGGGVQLTAATTSGVAGSVQFLDGSTALGTVAVASNTASFTATGLTAGAHSFTAVFTPSDPAYAGSTSGAVSTTAAVAPAALSGNVSGAELEWGFSAYAQVGSSVPPSPLTATTSGWAVTVDGGPEKIAPAGSASSGFRLTGGTGSADPVTGVGALSFPGSVSYTPYAGQPSFTLSGFVLTLDSATSGTLTGQLSWTPAGGATAGPALVTLASFAVDSLTGDDGVFTLRTAAPAYVGTVASGTYASGYTAAWPASFIAAMAPAYRSFFYQTGTTQGNLNKPPLAITADYTAVAPTTTALAASASTVVAGGAVRLSATTTSGVDGMVEFFDGATSLGTPTPTVDGASSIVASGLTIGAHSYTAVFTPSSGQYGISTSPARDVTVVAAPVLSTGNVSGAELEWGLSSYALIGTAVPSSPLVATGAGFNFSATGGAEVVDPITRTGPGGGTTGTGFRLTGGTGSVDQVTGQGVLTFPGSVTYAPYNYALNSGDFTLSGFRLTIADGTGTLTAVIASKDSPTAPVLGPVPATLASFDIDTLEKAGTVFDLTTEAPAYAGTVAAGTYSGSYTDAWPSSFIAAIPSGFRAFFYQSGVSQANTNKAPLPITASYTATVPTETTLTASATSVITGGAVQLTAGTPSGVAGTVEFFEGATSRGSATVAAGAASVVVSGLTAGAHAYTAVFTPDDLEQHGSSTSAVLTVTAVAAPATSTGNVSGAELEWGLSSYALIGTAVPSSPLVATGAGFNFSATGGAEVVDPITRTGPGGGTTGTGFRLTGGTGQVDPANGQGIIDYPGSVTYAPYNYALNSGDFVLSGFRLTIANGTGTLTGLVTSTNSPTADVLGPVQVTLASFTISSLVSDDGEFTLVTNAPAYAGTVAAGTYSGSYTDAWPSSFIAAIPSGFRAFFYQSGVSQANTNKAPLPITARFTADATTTVLGISVSQTSGLQSGDTVTVSAAVTPATAVGTVRLLLDGVVFASGAAAGAPFTAATPALAAGAHTLRAEFVPTDANVFGASTSASIPVTVTAPVTPRAGSLRWGVSSAFNAYVTGPIANGAITVGNGATASGGAFAFAQTTGGDYDATTGLGSVNYRGAVRYYGHGGALDQTLSNPVVRIDSAGSATLYATAAGSQVAFAALDLAAGTRTTASDGSVTYTAVPTRLLAGGAAFFDGNYAVGSALSPATFTVGSASTASDAPTTTVASAGSSESDREPAAAPPATEGIEVDGSIVEGGTITASASGFAPNEEGILVVIYSEPTVLTRDLTADADGVATWTGRLPVGLTGEHTLTFQGSVNRGVVLDIAAAATGVCPVEDATLTWGFKESFRAYIDGSIANGEWTVSDGATYETPDFGFSGGEGDYDPATGEGSIAFPGSIEFTGHSGALDTTVARPTVTFLDGDTAVLALDVTGVTQEGQEVSSAGVEFVELDLSAATITEDGGIITIAGAPATLTAAGAEAFGTYPEGEEFDAVTIAITPAADCAEASDPATESPEATEEPASDTGAVDLTWLWWTLGGLVLLAIIVAIVVLLVRRNRVG